MTEANIEESSRVKKFDKFISDIKILSESRKKIKHSNSKLATLDLLLADQDRRN